MPTFEFWNFYRIMAIKPMEHGGSKLGFMGFFNITIKLLIARIYWNFVTLAGLGNRPQAQMTINLQLKAILALRLFQRALICPVLNVGTQVLLEQFLSMNVRKATIQDQVLENQRLCPFFGGLFFLIATYGI
jgi:hypothetical protein